MSSTLIANPGLYMALSTTALIGADMLSNWCVSSSLQLLLAQPQTWLSQLASWLACTVVPSESWSEPPPWCGASDTSGISDTSHCSPNILSPSQPGTASSAHSMCCHSGCERLSSITRAAHRQHNTDAFVLHWSKIVLQLSNTRLPLQSIFNRIVTACPCHMPWPVHALEFRVC